MSEEHLYDACHHVASEGHISNVTKFAVRCVSRLLQMCICLCGFDAGLRSGPFSALLAMRLFPLQVAYLERRSQHGTVIYHGDSRRCDAQAFSLKPLGATTTYEECIIV